MNYRMKGISVCIFFLLMAPAAHSAERWNVLIADWRNLSNSKNMTIGVLIKKSIAEQLSKDRNFQVLVATNGMVSPENARDAILLGITNRADFVVTGYYYFGNYFIQGEKLAVIVEIYDVLNKRLTFRKIYTGTVSADIFDTIDIMTGDLKESVKKVIPPITEENEENIRVKREMVFNQENVKITRMFYSRIGIYTELGNNYLSSGGNGGGGPGISFSGQYPQSDLLAGLALMLWDLRLDIFSSSIPLPVYNWNPNTFGSQMNITMNLIGFSYYLPWFEHKFALGLGFQLEQNISTLYIDSYQRTNFQIMGPPYVPVSVLLTWDPSADLDISAVLLPVFYKVIWTANNQNSSSGTYQSSFQYNIPPVQLGVIKFFGDFGIEARINFYWSIYSSVPVTNSGNSSYYSDITALGFYIGFVYRVDFNY